jgi:two-component sensor histidine kinase
MSEPAPPLSHPLPHDLAAGEAPFIQFYQKYAVFSWPWAWRRTLVFGAIGVVAGLTFGITHGLYVNDVGEAIAVSITSSSANVALVGAGPLIAAWIRHRFWPARMERTLIIAAVVFGIVAGAASDLWAGRFHDRLMDRHASHAPKALPPPQHAQSDLHDLVAHALDVSRDLLILFIASGGLALSAYLSEARRWAEHRRRVELERMSLEKSEADLNLKVLQAQVEPHFLFNTLASVRSLVASDPQRAAQTIDALAQHLRATLPKLRAAAGKPQSTLAEQFSICASYLELMKVRLGDRLHVELDLPPALAELAFPPLLLISLVENAVKHGAEPKPGATHIRLAARESFECDRRCLEVSVEDNGAGLRMGTGEGTGLANIRAQLMTRFGSEAQLELVQREGGGVRARLLVPLERPVA